MQWNGYEQTQRDIIWQRLFELRRQAVAAAVRVVDDALFAAYCEVRQLPPQTPWELAAYEVLRTTVVRDQDPAEFGLQSVGGLPSLLLLRAIDSDVFHRSQAHYEHSFRVAAE